VAEHQQDMDLFVARALCAMDRSLQEIPSIHALCLRLGISRSGFHARFVQEVGEPPGRYLSRLRALRARELLSAHPELTIDAVARRVGYSCGEAANRAFWREFGAAPGVVCQRKSNGRRPSATTSNRGGQS